MSCHLSNQAIYADSFTLRSKEVVLRYSQACLIEKWPCVQLKFVKFCWIFKCLYCYFWFWNSIRDYQIGDSRMTRILILIFAANQGVLQIIKFSSRKFCGILQKSNCHLNFMLHLHPPPPDPTPNNVWIVQKIVQKYTKWKSDRNKNLSIIVA